LALFPQMFAALLDRIFVHGSKDDP
jgi:hypothetical protein